MCVCIVVVSISAPILYRTDELWQGQSPLFWAPNIPRILGPTHPSVADDRLPLIFFFMLCKEDILVQALGGFSVVILAGREV